MGDIGKELRRPVIVVPGGLLLVLLAVLFATRGQMQELAFLRKGAVSAQGLVDQRPAQTAQTLAGLAVSAEEQHFAQEAERLAEHEVDAAFQMALRQAALDQRAPTGAAAGLAARVDGLKATVKDDQTKVDALAAAAKADGGGAQPGDDLDVARAQLALDDDELTDAEGDLARETGDRRGEIEQELTARQAAAKKSDAAVGSSKATMVTAVRQFGTLVGRVDGWLAQNQRSALLEQARQQALDDARQLAGEHTALDAKSMASGAKLADPAMTGSARVKMLTKMATRRSVMSLMDDRAETDRELADLYARWEQQVVLQHGLLGHLILESVALLLGIVLLASLLAVVSRVLVMRLITEPRQARTLRTVVTLVVEVVAVLAGLLVLFGVPQQMPTILGLATAGLTVVFQDFILAFFGWFILMGPNGIRMNDWVEINGIGGEVAEIGLFRTTLLETGNWTAQGHPTGRRVTLINSFAIRGQYFNFTTHGQWMWEEIRLSLPATAKVYELIRQMQSAVEQETAENSEQAALEWRHVHRESGVAQFSAQPTVDLRPSAAGVEIVVRFVTRAGERFEVGNRVYEALMKLQRDGLALPPAGDAS